MVKILYAINYKNKVKTLSTFCHEENLDMVINKIKAKDNLVVGWDIVSINNGITTIHH